MAAFYQYLVFNSENLPKPDSYDITLESIEADSSGETEAGTRQRDVVRTGIVTIDAVFSVTSVWLAKLTAYAKLSSIEVQYFDTQTLTLQQTQMYIESFTVKLVKDTSYKGLWEVSLTLKEF